MPAGGNLQRAGKKGLGGILAQSCRNCDLEHVNLMALDEIDDLDELADTMNPSQLRSAP